MPHCPKCAQVVDRQGAVCSLCEADPAASASVPTLGDATVPSLAASQPDDLEQGSPAPGGRVWSRRHTWAATATAAAAAVMAVTVIGAGGRGTRSVPAALEEASIGSVTPGRGLPAASRALHTWTDANSARWVSNYPRSIAFELPAENTASGWMTRVRPVLVVRCLANTTDAFVFTQLSAAIEPLDERRTVQIAFDDDPAATERWAGSPDHDALFAPDGVSLARRIARARTMRFGFTPHNSPPAVLEFHVAGFSAHIESVARLCRWK
jgi:Type VI secretion system VasI, EvfG, VC_A0118